MQPCPMPFRSLRQRLWLQRLQPACQSSQMCSRSASIGRGSSKRRHSCAQSIYFEPTVDPSGLVAELFPPVPVLLPAIPVATELLARVVLRVRHQECEVASVPPRPRAVMRGRQGGQITCHEAAVDDADNAPYLHSCQCMLTGSPALRP
jgi:hypothetical protein